jgi:hypothetical protein
MDRSSLPSRRSLVLAARAKSSIALGGAEALLAVVDKLAEHALLSAAVDGLRDILGDSGVLGAILQHPWISWIILSLIWAAFVYLRARNSERHKPTEADREPSQEKPIQDVSGANARAAIARDVGGDLVLGDKYGSRDRAAEQPCISLRILRIDVDGVHHVNPVSKTDGGSLVEFRSIITLTFSALNTVQCPATLDGQSLEVITLSGRRIKCHDVTATRIIQEIITPEPPGVLRLEINAPLNYRETLTRFVRYFASEAMLFTDSEIGESRNIHEFSMLVLAARRLQEAYEITGTFRFAISDSHSLKWLAERNTQSSVLGSK